MKKVALYCRVSSDDQKERDTIENQIEILHTYIEMKEGFSVYNEYLDNGVSGTIPFEQRQSGSKLIKDAAKGLFNTVLVWKIDRFGRDTLSGLQAIEMLSKYNIEILSVTEPFDLNTPTGRFQFITYLNMAELERNNILDRMFIGATRAAKAGKWLGGIVPYGYIINSQGYLEINEEEAKVVRKIYELYLNGKLSTLDIAIYLNNINIPTSCGSGKGKRKKKITGKWRSTSIQRILSSTTYKGIHEYGKRGTRRKETILRKVPLIVPKEQWENVQLQKKKNALFSRRNVKNRDFLLRKMIKCKHCGKTFYGITYKGKSSVYSCAGKRKDNKKIFNINCTSVNINANIIEEQIWNDCLNIMKNYNKYIEQLEKKTESVDEEMNLDLKKLNKSLNNINLEKNNVITLFRKNLINESELEQQLKEIRIEEEKIKSLISALEDKLEIYTKEDELINNMSSKLNEYNENIDNLTFSQKYNLVRLLVKYIEAETVIEGGKKIPKVRVVYNLVKLNDYTDMDSNSKFDIEEEKKILPITGVGNAGMKLRNLRLKNNLTIKELAKKINISNTTLMHIEQNKINVPYYYWKIICDYFNIDNIEYLELYNMKEVSAKDKLLKIRACIGAKGWEDVGELLGYSEGFVNDMLSRYTPNKTHIKKMNVILEKLLK